MHRWMFAALLLVGCTMVVNPDVIGPHGEHLMELQCPTPDRCMDFARTVCHGDFDLVSDSSYAGYKGGTSEVVLVHCANAPPALAPTRARDAGP